MAAYYNDNDPFCCQVLRKQIALGNLPPGDIDERPIQEIDAEDLQGYQQVHLFAGIGGFPLGLRMGGMPDEFNIITGGFPCQPVSLAGKRLAQEDERWLWPEFARIIRALRTRYVLMENVPGLLSRGFGDVLRDLAACGYDAEWDCISAAAVGAPHLRERVWLIAYPSSPSNGGAVRWGHGAKILSQAKRDMGKYFEPNSKIDWNGVEVNRKSPKTYRHLPDEPRICRMDDGLSDWVDRLRALGNAVVPQVVAMLGRAILEVTS